MLFQLQLGLENAAQNFMRMFLRGQEIEQAERLTELEERKLKNQLDAQERALELEQARENMLLKSVAGQNAAFGAPSLSAQLPSPVPQQAFVVPPDQPQLTTQVGGGEDAVLTPGQQQAIGDARSGDQGAALQEVVLEAARQAIEDPESSPVQRVLAGQEIGLTPEQSTALGQEATFDQEVQAVLEELPDNVRPFAEGFIQTANVVGTETARLLFRTEFPETEREQLEKANLRLENQLRQRQIDEISRTLEQAQNSRVGLIQHLNNEGLENAEALVAGLTDSQVGQVTGALIERELEEDTALSPVDKAIFQHFLGATDELGNPRVNSLPQARALFQALQGTPPTQIQEVLSTASMAVGRFSDDIQNADSQEELDGIIDRITNFISEGFPGLGLTPEKLRPVVAPMVRRNRTVPPSEPAQRLREGLGERVFGEQFEGSPADRFFELLGQAAGPATEALTPTRP